LNEVGANRVNERIPEGEWPADGLLNAGEASVKPRDSPAPEVRGNEVNERATEGKPPRERKSPKDGPPTEKEPSFPRVSKTAPVRTNSCVVTPPVEEKDSAERPISSVESSLNDTCEAEAVMSDARIPNEPHKTRDRCELEACPRSEFWHDSPVGVKRRLSEKNRLFTRGCERGISREFCNSDPLRTARVSRRLIVCDHAAEKVTADVAKKSLEAVARGVALGLAVCAGLRLGD
jgi:hypothetical protein